MYLQQYNLQGIKKPDSRTIRFSEEITQTAQRLTLDVLRTRVSTLYPPYTRLGFNTTSHRLAALLTVSEGHLTNKKIIDLACGACPSNTWDPEGNPDPAYEPWLCRLLYPLGLDITGADLGNLEGELFEHYSGINLLDPYSLDSLTEHSFDIVHASTILSGEPYTSQSKNWGKIYTAIDLHAQRLLKKDGILLTSYEF